MVSQGVSRGVRDVSGGSRDFLGRFKVEIPGSLGVFLNPLKPTATH